MTSKQEERFFSSRAAQARLADSCGGALTALLVSAPPSFPAAPITRPMDSQSKPLSHPERAGVPSVPGFGTLGPGSEGPMSSDLGGYPNRGAFCDGVPITSAFGVV